MHYSGLTPAYYYSFKTMDCMASSRKTGPIWIIFNSVCPWPKICQCTIFHQHNSEIVSWRLCTKNQDGRRDRLIRKWFWIDWNNKTLTLSQAHLGVAYTQTNLIEPYTRCCVGYNAIKKVVLISVLRKFKKKNHSKIAWICLIKSLVLYVIGLRA